MQERVAFIDSHTGGEPTRLILDGAPDLGSGDLASRSKVFRSRHRGFSSGVIDEPRGSEVFVGALLCPPSTREFAAAVIFFNNVDLLGMCGHGMIGVATCLHHLGRLATGTHRIETPVGGIDITLNASGDVSLANVPSYRFTRLVSLHVPGVGPISGEVAWGGNWFFLAESPIELELSKVSKLVELSQSIKSALADHEIRGAGGAEVDHIELYGPAKGDADIRSFVLCPGGAWDRSPCGTGTSAKMACLAEDGKLEPQQEWRQESIVGSVFRGFYAPGPDNTILPTIQGTAHVMSEGFLHLSSADPFRWGLGSRCG